MFTVNWFENVAINNFEKNLKVFKDKHNLNFLEVGVFEGRATLWLLENILTHSTSKIDVIDTFKGGIEHQIKSKEYQLDTLKQRFLDNISNYKDKVNINIGFSQDILPKLEKEKYDFIYIDASHRACDVIEDAVLAFKCLKVGGIIAFDDYLWDRQGDPLQHPQVALDCFLTIFADRIKIKEKNYQLFLQKIECYKLMGNILKLM